MGEGGGGGRKGGQPRSWGRVNVWGDFDVDCDCILRLRKFIGAL